MVLSAAVSSGVISAVQAWPEFFGPGEEDDGAFPATGADMSGFELEEATPESYAADMSALIAASSKITVREEEPPLFPRLPGPQPPDLLHPEWT